LNHLRHIIAISKRIKEDHKGKDWQGSEECPICQGRLLLSHSKTLGHVAGSCETSNCLNWME
jgi:hypothetical protein